MMHCIFFSYYSCIRFFIRVILLVNARRARWSSGLYGAHTGWRRRSVIGINRKVFLSYKALINVTAVWKLLPNRHYIVLVSVFWQLNDKKYWDKIDDIIQLRKSIIYKEIWKAATRFLVVRHPFARIFAIWNSLFREGNEDGENLFQKYSVSRYVRTQALIMTSFTED